MLSLGTYTQVHKTEEIVNRIGPRFMLFLCPTGSAACVLYDLLENISGLGGEDVRMCFEW